MCQECIKLLDRVGAKVDIGDVNFYSFEDYQEFYNYIARRILGVIVSEADVLLEQEQRVAIITGSDATPGQKQGYHPDQQQQQKQGYHPGQGVTVIDKQDKNLDREGFVRDYKTDETYDILFEPGCPDEQYKENQIIPNQRYMPPNSMPPKVK